VDFPQSAQDWLDSFLPVTPVDHVGEIAPRPLIIIHGSEDDVVPLSHARRMFEKAGEPKELKVIEGAGHRLRQEPEVFIIVLDWLEKCRLNRI
jgi:putative redox protein